MVAARLGLSERRRNTVEAQLLASGVNERTTPALALDQALSLLRRASAEQWLRGSAASLPLAAVLLGLYALAQIPRDFLGGVAVRSALPLFGLFCALAYWARFRVLSSLARELVLRPRELGRPRARFGTARAVALLERGATIPSSTDAALGADSDTIIDQAHTVAGLGAHYRWGALAFCRLARQ
jgi:hypothetical protein